MIRVTRRAFTLVELLVVVVMISMLMGLFLPGIQATRDAARRAECTQNVARLMIAVQGYESAQEALPPGVTDEAGPIQSVEQGKHLGWLVQLLPYLEERNIYRALDLEAGAYDPKNAELRNIELSQFVCPAAENLSPPRASSYAGCQHDVEAPIDADNSGVLFLNSRVRWEDITDGSSQTIIIGEKRIEFDDLGWISGTRATLRNTGSVINAGPTTNAKPATYVGGFGSVHPGGFAMFGFGDGHVRPLFDTINASVLQQLGNRADGKVLSKADLD